MKKFVKNNTGFSCLICKAVVPAHPSSSRDHCNHCLFGLHVDNFPGDRANKCGGILVPVGLNIKGETKTIMYRCQKCGKAIRCIAAPDDNFEKLIELSKKVYR